MFTFAPLRGSYLADRVIIMGPAPRNIRKDVMLPPDRIRDRSSESMRATIADLRASLDALPCCVGKGILAGGPHENGE